MFRASRRDRAHREHKIILDIDQDICLLLGTIYLLISWDLTLKQCKNFKFEIFLKYYSIIVHWRLNVCSGPKRGAFDLNFCWGHNAQLLRGTRSDPNLVPLKKSSKSHGQKLRLNTPLFGLFWRCVFDTTEVKHTVLDVTSFLENILFYKSSVRKRHSIFSIRKK